MLSRFNDRRQFSRDSYSSDIKRERDDRFNNDKQRDRCVLCFYFTLLSPYIGRKIQDFPSTFILTMPLCLVQSSTLKYACGSSWTFFALIRPFSWNVAARKRDMYINEFLAIALYNNVLSILKFKINMNVSYICSDLAIELNWIEL